MHKKLQVKWLTWEQKLLLIHSQLTLSEYTAYNSLYMYVHPPYIVLYIQYNCVRVHVYTYLCLCSLLRLEWLLPRGERLRDRERCLLECSPREGDERDRPPPLVEWLDLCLSWGERERDRWLGLLWAGEDEDPTRPCVNNLAWECTPVWEESFCEDDFWEGTWEDEECTGRYDCNEPLFLSLEVPFSVTGRGFLFVTPPLFWSPDGFMLKVTLVPIGLHLPTASTGSLSSFFSCLTTSVTTTSLLLLIVTSLSRTGFCSPSPVFVCPFSPFPFPSLFLLSHFDGLSLLLVLFFVLPPDSWWPCLSAPVLPRKASAMALGSTATSLSLSLSE